MATPQAQAPANTLDQLNKLRYESLKNEHHYPAVVPSILGFISPGNPVELRRWGADFLAEALASPMLGLDVKQGIALKVIDLLRQYLEMPGEDAAVIRSVVQACTTIYPLVFKHIIYNPSDNSTWTHMAAIKSNILRRMDSSPSGVKVCCIKFIQRVVQVQTPGQIADPRRPESNEVSLALVPPTHPLISSTSMEPEGLGLLDRLLSVFQDQEQQSDAIYVTATLNCIGVLLRTRPAISNRILNAVMSFNPFKLAQKALTSRTRIMMRSIERTVRAFLTNLIKRNPSHPLQPRIHDHLERMQQARAEMYDETRKRSAPSEPTDGLDSAKRQRLDAQISTPLPTTSPVNGPPPGPISLAQLFTLTNDRNIIIDINSFQIPPHILLPIVQNLLRLIDRSQYDAAINAVRARWLSIAQIHQTAASVSPSSPIYPAAPTTQVMNQMEHGPVEPLPAEVPAELNLGQLEIPQPLPLSQVQVETYGKQAIDRAIGTLIARENTTPPNSKKPGFNRLALTTPDGDASIIMLIRLATRPTAGLHPSAPTIKSEIDNDFKDYSMADGIRAGLLTFILTDFRKRIDYAMAWLNEEWYSERLTSPDPLQHTNYNKWALHLLDGLLPYLDAKDKQLLRFLSEIPELNVDMIARVKKLAQDPERVPLAIMALQYLIMLRPPVKEMCLDAVEDMYKTNPVARAKAADVLKKHRPPILPPPEPAASVKTEGGTPLVPVEQKAAA